MHCVGTHTGKANEQGHPHLENLVTQIPTITRTQRYLTLFTYEKIHYNMAYRCH